MGEQKRKEQSKEEAFKEDPDRFVDKRDIIFAAIVQEQNGEKGMGFLLNEGLPSSAFKIAHYDMSQGIDMLLMRRKALEEANNAKNGIVTPGDEGIIAP